MSDFPDYAEVNRDYWNRHADWWVNPGRRNWLAEPHWGVWGIPNDEMPLLPDDMRNLDAIELGCGTGYVSSWMVRRGARAVGIDPSERQLETARSLSSEHGIEIELIHGVAESVPKPDASFDFAISEYGAATWADPYVWIPEAWRLLKPGGRLAFLGFGILAMVCARLKGDGETSLTLQRDYFGLHAVEYTDENDRRVEFNLPISDWLRLFKQTGFIVEDFVEIRAPDSADGEQFGTSAEWARRFPSEQAWRLRKLA